MEASTLPDGLISTTTTFAIPTLVASATRPVIFMFVRRRAAAARNDSSEGGGASVVVVGWVAAGVGVAVTSDVGFGTELGKFSLVVSGFAVSARAVSGVGDFSGKAAGGVDSIDVAEVGCVLVSAVAGGLLTAASLVAAAGASLLAALLGAAAPIRSSSPSSEPLILR